MLVSPAVPHTSRLPMSWRVTAFLEGPGVRAEAEVRVDGDIDSASVDDLLDTLAALIRPSVSVLLIDMSDCGFVGAGALQQLEDFVSAPSQRCPQVRLRGLSKAAQEIVKLADLRTLSSALRTEDDDDSAVGQHSKSGQLTVAWLDDECVDVSLAGEFDIANEANMRAALDPIAADGRPP